MAFGFRRTDGVEGCERVTDAALAAEIDVVERVRGRYPAGSRINFGAPARCPRCPDFGLVDKVDLTVGRSHHHCRGCGYEWVISVRALLAVDGRRPVAARGPRAWLAELASRRSLEDGLAPASDLEGVRFTRTADGEVVREPVAEATEPLAPAMTDDGPAPWVAPVLPLRVLLVEDDPDQVQAVQTLVEPSGTGPAVIDLRTASTSAAGEVVARVSAPDLVLLDLGLPDSRGEETLARWRDHAGSAPVLIVGDDGSTPPVTVGRGVAGVVDRAELARLLDQGEEGRAAFAQLLGSSSVVAEPHRGLLPSPASESRSRLPRAPAAGAPRPAP